MKADIGWYQVSYLTLICLMATLCGCIEESKRNNSEKKDLYNYSVTQKLNLHVNANKTDLTHIAKDFGYENETVKSISDANVTRTEKVIDAATQVKPGETPLPIPIMVASPAVAVGIFIFICVAYKWHTAQLDAQAKELAAQMASGECSSPCIPCSPCHNTLLPPRQSINSASPFHSDSDLLGARRKSLRTPSPILLAPPGLENHRGSSWSALSDQEVISHLPNRHSTFLL